MKKSLRYLASVLLPGFFLACSCTQTQATLAEGVAKLIVPGFRWQAPQIMQLSGVPMYVRNFSSNSAVIQAAQSLAAHSGLFERVLKIHTKVVLSGLSSNWHWLAEIDATNDGARGYVSALRTDAAQVGERPLTAELPLAWLPPEAKRQFDHQNTVAGRRVVQQIYSVALPMSALTSYVRKQLRTEGWMPEPQLAGEGAGMVWSKSGGRLMLLAQQGTSGTSLYVHYAE